MHADETRLRLRHRRVASTATALLRLTGGENRLCAFLLAEFIGSALLVAVVVGSGIAAAQLSPDDVGLQLLENSVATASRVWAS